MLSGKVTRVKKSHSYMRDPKAPKDWHNNDNNNSLDQLELFDENDECVFSSPAQTIANMEGLGDGYSYKHSLKPGSFNLECFVPRRSFYGHIHGIRDAENLDGETIGEDCTTPSSQLRMLCHDWQKKAPINPGQDTRVAWSDGCIVLPTKKLFEMGHLLGGLGYNPGDLIPFTLVEVDSLDE